jgi:hypothetical protein
MQTYYAVGYVHALEKLGMVDKTSAPAAVQKVMGLVSKGGRQGRQVARAFEGGAARQAIPGGMGAVPTIDLAGQGSLTQALKAGKKAPGMQVPMPGHSYAAPEQIANMPSGAEAFGMPGVKGTRIGKLEGPMMSQQGLGPATSGGATKGKAQQPPVVESRKTPDAKAAPAAATGGGAAAPAASGEAAPASQGLLSKYKWPILGGAGLAGLGGYAYLKNRDPMPGYPVQGY